MQDGNKDTDVSDENTPLKLSTSELCFSVILIFIFFGIVFQDYFDTSLNEERTSAIFEKTFSHAEKYGLEFSRDAYSFTFSKEADSLCYETYLYHGAICKSFSNNLPKDDSSLSNLDLIEGELVINTERKVLTNNRVSSNYYYQLSNTDLDSLNSNQYKMLLQRIDSILSKVTLASMFSELTSDSVNKKLTTSLNALNNIIPVNTIISVKDLNSRYISANDTELYNVFSELSKYNHINEFFIVKLTGLDHTKTQFIRLANVKEFADYLPLSLVRTDDKWELYSFSLVNLTLHPFSDVNNFILELNSQLLKLNKHKGQGINYLFSHPDWL